MDTKKIIFIVSITIKKLYTSIIWYIFNYASFYKKMKSLNIVELKIFNFLQWHQGAYYFKGKNNNTDIFIKTDYEFKLLSNESKALELLNSNNYLKYKTANLLFIDSVSSEYLCTSFVKGISLRNYIEENKNNELKIKNIINQMINILKEFQTLKIIHRDIRLENFIISNDTAYVIDFLFTISNIETLGFKELDLNNKNNLNILKTLGIKEYPNKLKWDDAYSLWIIFEDIKALIDVNIEDEINETKTLIGNCTYEI